MINERVEVEKYLQGKNYTKATDYRVCYLLSKYYYEQGFSRYATRQAIFDWGNKYHIQITTRVNDVVDNVFDNKEKLVEKEVYISNKDVDEIKARFDIKSERIVALAILCYAKAMANQSGEFILSIAGIASWTGYGLTTVKAAMKRLRNYEYVEIVDYGKTYSWFGTVKTKCNTYRLSVDTYKKHDYKLEKNDLNALYSEINW